MSYGWLAVGVYVYITLIVLLLRSIRRAKDFSQTQAEQDAEYDLQYEELRDPTIDNRTGRKIV